MTHAATFARSLVCLVLLAALAPLVGADCPDDDPYELNDDCSAPLPLPSFLSSWFTIFGAAHPAGLDEDYWVLEDVFPGETIELSVFYLTAEGDVDAELYGDLGCTNLLDASADSTGYEIVSATNTGSVPVDYYVRIVAPDPGLVCIRYSMQVSRSALTCPLAPNDGFEPNDDCSSAASLALGVTPLLFLTETAGDPADYFAIDVPPGELLTIDMQYAQGSDSPDLTLWMDAGCGQVVASDLGHAGTAGVQWANAATVTETLYLEVSFRIGGLGACGAYLLDLSSASSPCLIVDDGLEPNDDCAAAVPLSIGTTTGLFVSADSDFYLVDVPAGDALVVEVEYVAASYDEEVFLFLYDDVACANQIDTTWIGGGPDFVEWINDTGAAVTLRLEVDIADAFCNDYDLHVSLAADACVAGLPEDLFEDADDCASAALLVPGTYEGLTVRRSDDDYYAVDVPAGQSLHVFARFAEPTDGLQLFLYDSIAQCDDVQLGWVAGGTDYAAGVFADWHNDSASTVRVLAGVSVYPNPGFYPECGEYELDVILGDDPATPFCFGDGTLIPCPCANESAPGAGEGCLNSQSQGARLTAFGSSVIANDDLGFSLTQGRPHQPSLLVRGTLPIALPFKDGVFCMGNQTLRVEVVTLDAGGSGSTSGSMVHAGPIAPWPGKTSFYQQWYRDPALSPCGSGSNFSQGLIVLWR